MIDTYTQESGLPAGRAIGERSRTIGQLKEFANILEKGSWVEATIDTAQPNREPIPKEDIRKGYKAIPKDFDLDGNLDIAAISFFPYYLD